VLLAVATIVGVAIGFRASNLSGAAGGDGTTAVRDDIRRGGAIIDAARKVYAEDAPLAFQMAEVELRADQDRSTAADATDPLTRQLLRFDAHAQAGLAAALRDTSSWITDPRTAPDLDGADLVDRFEEIRASNPEATQIDVASSQESAEDDRRKSTLLIGALIPVALAVLFGSLAEFDERRRARLVTAGWAAIAVGLVLAVLIEVVV
jgi:hypothetical protein